LPGGGVGLLLRPGFPCWAGYIQRPHVLPSRPSLAGMGMPG
jgi:hypothetical protein